MGYINKPVLPCLLFFTQLYSEFHRITNLNLPSTFYAALDKYTPQLLQLYKKRKTGSFGQKMEAVMMAFEEQVCFFLIIISCIMLLNVERANTNTSYAFPVFMQQDKNDICAARTAALVGLPQYLKEDSSDVFRTCKVCS